ncbi:zinc finger protein 120-like isoform X2 [Alexandromys fortis]|uniref:zinc finger protein 120-like isoform X2 n=1 Tax=Alexandromys fortis TaxID=100897 RepID=UPI002152EA0B|nr:zinc finger protein 120-like isoform X2 [Microtus fortis]
MLETYRNLAATGYSWEDHNFEEHCQSARKHGRNERNHNVEKPSVFTQYDKAFACYSHLQSHGKNHSKEKSYDIIQYDEGFADVPGCSEATQDSWQREAGASCSGQRKHCLWQH